MRSIWFLIKRVNHNSIFSLRVCMPCFVVTFNHQDTTSMAHEFLPKRSFNLDLELRRGGGLKREFEGGSRGFSRGVRVTKNPQQLTLSGPAKAFSSKLIYWRRHYSIFTTSRFNCQLSNSGWVPFIKVNVFEMIYIWIGYYSHMYLYYKGNTAGGGE